METPALVLATSQQEFSDADFRVVDNADQSKKLAFQVSGVTTGTTRTLTVPDASGTIAVPEEGTWTPALLFGGAAVGMTGTFSGTYTKIGRLVFARGTLTLTAKGSSTGSATISGFPYAAGASTAGVVGQAALFTGLTGALQAFITGSAVTLRQSGAAGNTTITDAVFQDTTVFQIAVTYET